MRLKPIAAALAAAGLLAAGGAGAWSLSEAVHGWTTSATSTTAVASAAPTSVAPAIVPAGTAPNYRGIVQANGPAVVGVTVAGTRKIDAAEMPGLPDDPFFQFFRGLPHAPFGPQEGAIPFRGQGSGFIVSSDGVILTNAHVVRDAKEVMVKLADRRELRAKVLGSDATTDIAVLKVDAKNLPVVSLGDDKQVQVGDYVLAIGAPFGFEQTATQGIVSAKGRSLPGDSYVPFIQTDAAVNPGNSGGPLFDASGRVVGINAQIFSRSGGFQGLAFAIPIDVALHVKDEIVHHGKIEHARLGVTVQDLNQGLAESFGLKTPDGALVSSVMSGSAAARAELKPGDVITRIDGQPVHTGGDVSTRVGMASPGDKVQLTVWRDKASRDIDVKLGALADSEVMQASSDGSPGALGLAVRPLTSSEKLEAHADHGLLVEDVSGAAARAGIQPGDVVLSLNGKPVDSADQIRKAIEKHPQHLALLIQRDSEQIFVPINLG
jgi:serine protease Do